jgi:hypothetical protein
MNEAAVASAEVRIRHLALKIEGLEFPASDRNRVAAACFHQALEHHEAIVRLVRLRLYGSAFALVRPLFESYVRAIWLGKCANDSDLGRFHKGKLNKEFGALVSDIEAHEGYNVGVIARVKSASWRAMNDFTHGGPLQIIRRITNDSIAANYANDEVAEALSFAGAIGLLATSEIALLANRIDIATGLLEDMKMFSKE